MPVSPNMPPAPDDSRHLTYSLGLRAALVRAMSSRAASCAIALCFAQAGHAAGATPTPLDTIPMLLGAALGVVLLRGLRD